VEGQRGQHRCSLGQGRRGPNLVAEQHTTNWGAKGNRQASRAGHAEHLPHVSRILSIPGEEFGDEVPDTGRHVDEGTFLAQTHARGHGKGGAHGLDDQHLEVQEVRDNEAGQDRLDLRDAASCCHVHRLGVFGLAGWWWWRRRMLVSVGRAMTRVRIRIRIRLGNRQGGLRRHGDASRQDAKQRCHGDVDRVSPAKGSAPRLPGMTAAIACSLCRPGTALLAIDPPAALAHALLPRTDRRDADVHHKGRQRRHDPDSNGHDPALGAVPPHPEACTPPMAGGSLDPDLPVAQRVLHQVVQPVDGRVGVVGQALAEGRGGVQGALRLGQVRREERLDVGVVGRAQAVGGVMVPGWQLCVVRGAEAAGWGVVRVRVGVGEQGCGLLLVVSRGVWRHCGLGATSMLLMTVAKCIATGERSSPWRSISSLALR
jgi:hypothetical protein